MSFTVHADKWSNLRGLTDKFGARVLSRFDRPATVEERERAIDTIIKALDEDASPSLIYDVLHSSNIGFMPYALDPLNASLKIDDMVATSLKKAKDSPSFANGWKKGLFSQTFTAAVDAKTSEEQEHVIKVFEKIRAADSKTANEILERFIDPDSETNDVNLRDAIAYQQKYIKQHNPELKFVSPFR